MGEEAWLVGHVMATSHAEDSNQLKQVEEFMTWCAGDGIKSGIYSASTNGAGSRRTRYRRTMMSPPEPSAGETQPIEESLLRDVCGLFVTGVTVVTSVANNTPIGSTVNSFTSVSLKPPLILFCLHKESRLRRGLVESRMFVVNFLAGRQEQLAWNFAKRETATIPDDAYHRSAEGMPVISEALAFLACKLDKEFEGGDHTIVVGEVIELGSPRSNHEPLIFFRGSFSALEEQMWPVRPARTFSD
jgi:3-hydroxy-9,10-secoandrosta-1,3,5(10)-triene-9,17-dione monooxygenase reductase component